MCLVARRGNHENPGHSEIVSGLFVVLSKSGWDTRHFRRLRDGQFTHLYYYYGTIVIAHLVAMVFANTDGTEECTAQTFL